MGNQRSDDRILPLKTTTSRCPICHLPCPATISLESEGPRVLLTRTCPQHGSTSGCIASDSRFYWLAKGHPKNADCCGKSGEEESLENQMACCAADPSANGLLGRNAHRDEHSPFETLSTCLALIEIVTSCNLSCPTCYANSPLGAGEKVDAIPLDDLQRRIQGVIDRKGKIEILQFSGGEPTLHPQFFELLAWAKENPNIDYVLLNTNGVRLAQEPEFSSRLGALFSGGGLQLYLQFDGVDKAGQQSLRGADLRAMREKAIARCGELNIPITLAMTVTPENLSQVWKTIEYGLTFAHIHGITFQPVFGSGRNPATKPAVRLNTADILLAAIEQSNGRLQIEDFTPLPCGDPNCATIGYLIRRDGKTYPVSDFIDFQQLHGFLKDKIHYTMDDLARCGCETEPLGRLLKTLELKSSNTFRLMVKPFMDAWTWDQDRIDRCCTHVIRPDGKLDSFCRYYSGFPDTQAAP